MNAFSRKDAVGTLESYAAIIVLHLALITFFPKNDAQRHWQIEIDSFRKILARFNKGKSKSKQNFNVEFIIDALSEQFEGNHEKDILLSIIDTKGLHIEPEKANWTALETRVHEFARSV